MLDIFVCEDDPGQRRRICRFVEDKIMFDELGMRLVLATGDPYQILEEAEKSNNTGIYFLDINLNTTIDGIELARRLRGCDSRGFIVFITTYAEKAPITFRYRIEALDFIIKDRSQELSDLRIKVFECIDQARERYARMRDAPGEKLHIRIGDRDFVYLCREVIYFQTSANAHKIILYTTGSRLEFKGNLTSYADKSESFFRCHSSFVININNIVQVDYRRMKVLMCNGAWCDLSVRKARELKKKLQLAKQEI